MHRTRIKKIILVKSFLLSGLGNLASGLFFGTGCIIVDHIDGWLNPQDDTTALIIPQQQKPLTDNIFTNIS